MHTDVVSFRKFMNRKTGLCRSPEAPRLGREQDKGLPGAVVLQFLTGAVVTQVSSSVGLSAARCVSGDSPFGCCRSLKDYLKIFIQNIMWPVGSVCGRGFEIHMQRKT